MHTFSISHCEQKRGDEWNDPLIIPSEVPGLYSLTAPAVAC
eukprot:gene13222-9068_t